MENIVAPPTGAIISWQKSGCVAATALHPNGTEVKVYDYDTAAGAIDGPRSRKLRSGNGWGVHWIPAEDASALAAANLEAIDKEIARAERNADDVVAFVAEYQGGEPCGSWAANERRLAKDYPDMGYGSPERLAAARAENVAARTDGWVRTSDSTCDPIRRMLGFGDPALAAALLRRGKVVLFASYDREGFDGWRLCDPHTATLALLASALVELIWAVGPQGKKYRGASLLTHGTVAINSACATRPFDPVVDVISRDRATWASVQ